MFKAGCVFINAHALMMGSVIMLHGLCMVIHHNNEKKNDDVVIIRQA